VAPPSSICIPMGDSVLKPMSGHHVGLPDMFNAYVDGSQACGLGHMLRRCECIEANNEAAGDAGNCEP
jgi:hypothetical protein